VVDRDGVWLHWGQGGVFGGCGQKKPDTMLSHIVAITARPVIGSVGKDVSSNS
jgi:hypothetical protein